MMNIDRCSSAPPGLDSPGKESSWPVRNRRRHAATVEFQNLVMSQFLEVFRRLDSIDARITPQAKHDPNNVAQHIGKDTATLVEIEKRVRSMELVLFRTSMHDVQYVDAPVAKHRQTARILQGTRGTRC